MTIWVVYIDEGFGDRSAPLACFSTEKKAQKWIDSNLERSRSLTMRSFSLDGD